VTAEVYVNLFALSETLSCLTESCDAIHPETKVIETPEVCFVYARTESVLTSGKCILSSLHKLEELRRARGVKVI